MFLPPLADGRSLQGTAGCGRGSHWNWKVDGQASGMEISGASHQQIGETIGASRETVTRTLGDFRSQGLIDLGRSHIVIKDRDGLDELCHQPQDV